MTVSECVVSNLNYVQSLGQLAFTLNFHTSVWKQMTYDVRCYPDTRGQQQVANKHASWLRPGRKQRSYV